MSDEEEEVEEQHQPRDPEKPFTGRAVENGVVRFTSVSQIKMFDAESEGCPRKWAYRYVFGIKLEKTGALTKGDEFAKSLEHYLKTGEDLLPPTLRPLKPYLPVPGGDLEVERKFATGVKGKDIEKAIAAREQLVKLLRSEHAGTAVFRAQIEHLRTEIKKYARLVVHDIPVDGAADVRHHRGVFVDEDGKLRSEVPGMVVGETGDLKTVSRIHPHKITRGENAGTILPAFALNAAQICEDPQMLAYGVYDADTHSELTHVRLSHYYANKTKREAEKRTGLLSIEQLRERFHRRVEQPVLEMHDVAQASCIEEIEPNIRACDSFTHVDPENPKGKPKKGCGYRYQCPLSTEQMSLNMFGNSEVRGMSLFDTVNQPQVPATPAAPQPPHDEAAYRAQVEAERLKLAAQTAPGVQQPSPPAPAVNVCVHCGTPLDGTNSSRKTDGTIKHIGCAAAAVVVAPPPVPANYEHKAVAPPPPPPGALAPTEGAVGVKPPDAPTVDWIDAARPMPPAEIAAVENPEMRARLELHSKLWHEREAARLAEQAKNEPPVESKWCQPQSPKIVISPEIVLAKKFICHCGKSYSLTTLKPIQEGDKLVSVIPRHKPVNAAPAAPPAPPAAPALPPSPPQQQMQLASSVAPPPPSPSAPQIEFSGDEDEEEEIVVPSPQVLQEVAKLAQTVSDVVSSSVIAPPPPPPVNGNGFVNGTNAAFQAQAAGEMTKMMEEMFGPEGQPAAERFDPTVAWVADNSGGEITVTLKITRATLREFAQMIASYMKGDEQ